MKENLRKELLMEMELYFFFNGDRYEGKFSNDKLHGKGIFYYKDGKKEKHRYEEDVLVSRE